jgi:hypothetical protein
VFSHLILRKISVTHPKDPTTTNDKKMQKSPRKNKTLTKTPTGAFPLSMGLMMPELPSLPGLPPLPTAHTSEPSSSESTSKESRSEKDKEKELKEEPKELKKASADKLKVVGDTDGEVEVCLDSCLVLLLLACSCDFFYFIYFIYFIFVYVFIFFCFVFLFCFFLFCFFFIFFYFFIFDEQFCVMFTSRMYSMSMISMCLPWRMTRCGICSLGRLKKKTTRPLSLTIPAK